MRGTFSYGRACQRHPEIAGRRYKSSNECVACQVARSARYNARNPDKRRTAVNKHAARRAALLAGLKLERGCADCGYKAHAEALEFDHVRGRKAFEIASGSRRPLAEVFAEVEKCDVVCANCHRVRTSERRKLEKQRVG